MNSRRAPTCRVPYRSSCATDASAGRTANRTKAAPRGGFLFDSGDMPAEHGRLGRSVGKGRQGMNKQDLVGVVAEAAGLARGDAARAVEAVFDGIAAALKRGDDVRLVGFGTFEVGDRKASNGRNPRTGEPMAIGASRVPKFRAGKTLKDSIR